VYTPLIERAEQVLARAKMFKRLETPYEARRVLDALNAVAERARTTGVGTMSGEPLLLTTKRVETPGPPDLRDTREDGIQTRARAIVTRSPIARWVGAAAAAALIVGAFAAVAAVRSRATPVIDPHVPITAAAIAVDPQGAGAARDTPPDSTDPASSADPNAAPMVMDLPDTPGHTAGAARSRNTKPSKPLRPKLLNTRE
jgi:hypothetical protein